MYASATAELRLYVATRLPWQTYLPLAVFLTTAATVGAYPQPTRWVAALASASILLLQFRLCDDLADRNRDARVHPHRVLVRSPSRRPFRLLVAVAFTINLVVFALLADSTILASFLLLNAALFLWYRRLRFRVADPLWSSHVVLLKYPAIVWLLSAWFSAVDAVFLVPAMILVYLCFCLYEMLHDPQLRSASRSSRLIAVEWAFLAATPSLAAFLHADRQWVPPWSLGIGAFLAATAAVLVVVRRNPRATSVPWTYTPFVIGFAQVLTLVMGSRP